MAATNQVPSYGANGARKLELSRTRQQVGKSLEQIAESTKISIRFLRAIEDEDFAKLPGGIFNTSYLRQYAAAIGFDEGKLLAQYHGGSDPGEEQERRPSLLRWLKAAVAAE